MKNDEKWILVVDDDKAVLESFRDVLQSRAYSVDTAETGREAIEKSLARHYNLALLDIKLPDIEGTKLLVKMHRETPRTMKIMVTGYPSLENAVEALNLGADAYVIKPVKPEDLLEVVEEKLKQQEEAEMMSTEKAAEWLETRAQKLEGKIVLRPIRIRNSLYLLIPMEVAKLTGVTKDTHFKLTVKQGKSTFLSFEKVK